MKKKMKEEEEEEEEKVNLLRMPRENCFLFFFLSFSISRTDSKKPYASKLPFTATS